MGRIYSGKPVKDTESAAESFINSSLFNNTSRNLSKTTVEMTITAHLQSDHQIDHFDVKKNKE